MICKKSPIAHHQISCDTSNSEVQILNVPLHVFHVTLFYKKFLLIYVTYCLCLTEYNKIF